MKNKTDADCFSNDSSKIREEQIKQQARKYFGDYLDGLKGEVLTVQQTFEDAAKWADETMLEKVCKWVQDNIDFYIDTNYDEDFKVNIEQLLKDIRKAVDE